MSGYFNIGKKLISGIGSAINKTKTNVPKSEIQKKLSIRCNIYRKSRCNSYVSEYTYPGRLISGVSSVIKCMFNSTALTFTGDTASSSSSSKE